MGHVAGGATMWLLLWGEHRIPLWDSQRGSVPSKTAGVPVVRTLVGVQGVDRSSGILLLTFSLQGKVPPGLSWSWLGDRVGRRVFLRFSTTLSAFMCLQSFCYSFEVLRHAPLVIFIKIELFIVLAVFVEEMSSKGFQSATLLTSLCRDSVFWQESNHRNTHTHSHLINKVNIQNRDEKTLLQCA